MDGKLFDPNRIDQNINLGSVIEWTLFNTSSKAHPHHIHIHPFQVVATSDGMLNGQPLLGPTWADTVIVPPADGPAFPPDPDPVPPSTPGWVRLRQRYPDFPGLYVIHCHILVHEDIGMMQIVSLA